MPHESATFERCTLNWDERERRMHHWRLHRDLLTIRREDRVFREQRAGAVDGAVLGPDAFALRYFSPDPDDERLLVVNLGTDLTAASFPEPLVAPPGGYSGWSTRWSSEHPDYGGLGTPDVMNDRGWRIPGHTGVVLRPAGGRSER